MQPFNELTKRLGVVVGGGADVEEVQPIVEVGQMR